MASIKIHQDLFNFKRTRKGLTDRQIGGMALAGGVAIGTTALLGYAIGIPYSYAVMVGLILALPIVIAGFVPIYYMPAEEFFQRLMDITARGNTISWQGEEVEPMKGATSREYRKKTRKRGAELLG